jgi:hypothetical protein
MPTLRAFFAYSSTYREVGDAISGAKELARRRRPELAIHLWPQNDISGRPLTDPIFESIAAGDVLIADITTELQRHV